MDNQKTNTTDSVGVQPITRNERYRRVLEAADRPGARVYWSPNGSESWYAVSTPSWDFSYCTWKVVIPGTSRWVPIYTKETFPALFSFGKIGNPDTRTAYLRSQFFGRAPLSLSWFTNLNEPYEFSTDGVNYQPFMCREALDNTVVYSE